LMASLGMFGGGLLLVFLLVAGSGEDENKSAGSPPAPELRGVHRGRLELFVA
jgi:hypothetical protein